MKYLAKIYVKNHNTLVLDCVNEEIVNKCYPAGKCKNPYNPNDFSYRMGSLVIGAKNIAISKEAIYLFTYLINNNLCSGKTTGDLGIYKTQNGKIAVNWSDGTHKEINKDDSIIIGCKYNRSNTDLLNELPIVPNEELIENQEIIR